MCGIAAIIHTNSAPVREEPLRAMMRAMKHRGPDDDGVYTNGNVGFGFVRLKIIDLSANGHQPMRSADGRHTIIFTNRTIRPPLFPVCQYLYKADFLSRKRVRTLPTCRAGQWISRRNLQCRHFAIGNPSVTGCHILYGNSRSAKSAANPSIRRRQTKIYRHTPFFTLRLNLFRSGYVL